MTTSQVSPPPHWGGTNAEWIVYRTLLGLEKIPRQDFSFNPNADDGVAFRFFNPPDLGVMVVGVGQQYAQGEDRTVRGILSRQQMAGAGVQLIFIDDVDLAQDPRYYVREALEYRDHSHLGS